MDVATSAEQPAGAYRQDPKRRDSARRAEMAYETAVPPVHDPARRPVDLSGCAAPERKLRRSRPPPTSRNRLRPPAVPL